ncbi:MAG: hypothetical protein ACETVR_04695 [Candidatus Bathyarchaeia archaeon]
MVKRKKETAELKCPKCGGTNIVQQGDYYQCQYTVEDPYGPSCGYLAPREEFLVQQGLDNRGEKVE